MTQEELLLVNVAARLKQLRQAAGLSQQEMAERIACGVRNYQRFETGQVNMSLRTLARLSAALGVSPIELLQW
jgi:transcriptional regulator with XRE-family HTH domain